MIIWCMVPQIPSKTDSFLSFWVIFALYPLKTQKIKILKKFKKLLEILSSYTCVQQMTIIWCMVSSDIKHDRHNSLSFWGIFCPLPPNNPENQNFEKIKKNSWEYYHFTYEYHKSKSYDAWFLRYGVQQTKCFLILDHFCPFTHLACGRCNCYFSFWEFFTLLPPPPLPPNSPNN